MGFIVGLVVGLAVGIAIIIGFVKAENYRSKLRSELVSVPAVLLYPFFERFAFPIWSSGFVSFFTRRIRWLLSRG